MKRNIPLSILSVILFTSIHSITQAQTTTVDVNKVYPLSEVTSKPVFAGGKMTKEDFLKFYQQFPVDENGDYIDGTAILSITVASDGAVEEAQVIQSDADELSDEAIRLMGIMPYFTPGKVNGQAVTTSMLFPVRFNKKAESTGMASDSIAVDTLAARMKIQPKQPLYLVNGKVITEDTDLSANKIKSIRVLKGDKATALYGSKGAYGVVLITTKDEE